MGKTLALFAGADASGKNNLWVTDGTTAGTSELNVAGAPANGLSPLQGFFVYGDKLLFDRYDNVGDFF
jgi:ELWxxDGT repeat protein